MELYKDDKSQRDKDRMRNARKKAVARIRKHLEENLGAIGWRLKKEDIKRLDKFFFRFSQYRAYRIYKMVLKLTSLLSRLTHRQT